ncbi:GtrA family protein [Sphaerisporangium corydalis]|uniref:GtrA family protein n=1 Tax=Sphaerisporangium corydalis TaxID=1441875 RepID=A0ABV9EQF9_9ACTN|nr:GtrA family protein [Sphaerisporangium corydalis]
MADAEGRPAGGEDPPRARRAFTVVLGGHLITYLTGGALAAVLYYAIMITGLLVVGGTVPYLYVVVTAHFATVVIVYPWYRLVVFPASGDSWPRGYLRFYTVGLGFLACSLAGLPILAGWAGIPVLVAQAIIIVANLAVSHAVHRAWTFGKAPASGRGNGSPALRQRGRRTRDRDRASA